MPGFVAVAPQADTPTPATIENDGFFPDIVLSAVRDTQRLDGTVTDTRLAHEILEAVIDVNAQLSAWRLDHIANGHMTLDTVPAQRIGGASVLASRYLRAVYCTAHANLIERYRNFDATASGRKEGEIDEPTADTLRRDARWAVRDLLGQTRTTVDLI